MTHAPAQAVHLTFDRRFGAQLRHHAPFLLIGLAVLLASLWIKLAYTGVLGAGVLLDLASLLLFWPLLVPALVPMLFFRVAAYEKPESPARALVASFRPYLTADGRLVPGLLMLFAVSLFMAGFAGLKASITLVQPFSWDQTFDRWDRALHFGYRPWEWLQPVLGFGPVTALININYHFWFISLGMFWLHFGFAERPGVLRTRAMLSFLVIWTVGGAAMAMLFSSAGPCFYGALGLAPDPYAGLTSYLRTASESWPVWAVALQDGLWQNFANHSGADAVKGISAMPSMHNAQCLLLVLATWNKGGLVRALAVSHGVLVFIGSIHLGWHYAVDAYIAFVLTAAVWIATGALTKWWEDHQLAVQSRRPS